MASPPSDLPEMEYRFLGRTGLQISAISIGGWLTYGGHVDEEKAHACLKAAYDAGINFFDLAEGYGGGESEVVVGRAIKKFGWKRNDIVITTKIYFGVANSAQPEARSKINNLGLSRKHIVEGTNLALQRLQLEYVDVIYAHRPDKLTPIEETVRAFNHVIDTGKAFYWGTSEWSAAEIEQAWTAADRLGLIGPIVEQPQYSLLERNKVEGEFKSLIQKRGLGLTIFSPLAGGILTGKYNNGIPEDSRLKQSDDKFIQQIASSVGSDPWNQRIEKVKKLQGIAEKLNTNLATFSLAWVLKNPDISSAITGASRPEQLWETVRALEVVKKIDDGVVEEVEGIVENKPGLGIQRFGL